MKKLTDDELNRKIHEWMDIKCEQKYLKWHEVYFCTKCANGSPNPVAERLCAEVENYCQDLNTVQKFLREVFTKRTPLEIIRSLMRVQGHRFPGAISDWTALEVMAFMMASPRQLAEAGAKAAGIWEGK